MEPRARYHRGESVTLYSWRKNVLERDKNKCQCCDGEVKDKFRNRRYSLEVHHVIPRKHGGRNTLNNGVTLCRFCHNYFDYMYTVTSQDYFEILKMKSRAEIIYGVKKLLKKRYQHHLLRCVKWERLW